jgi:hypothetical protein
MSMPTTKVELITAMEGGRRECDSVLAAIDEHALVEPGVEGAWSVQQIVAHVVGYEAWAAACLTDRRDPSAGALAVFDVYWQQALDVYHQHHPDFPARMSETDDDQTNAVVVAAYDRLSASDVLERERQIYQQLLAAIQALSEAQLAEPWREGGRSLLEILPNQSYDHYQTHLPPSGAGWPGGNPPRASTIDRCTEN